MCDWFCITHLENKSGGMMSEGYAVQICIVYGPKNHLGFVKTKYNIATKLAHRSKLALIVISESYDKFSIKLEWILH